MTIQSLQNMRTLQNISLQITNRSDVSFYANSLDYNTQTFSPYWETIHVSLPIGITAFSVLVFTQNLFSLFMFMEFSAVYLFLILIIPSSKRILAPKTAEVSGALTMEAFSADSSEPASKRPRVLTVAENVLCWEHLKPHLEEFSRLHPDDNMCVPLFCSWCRYAPSYDGRAYLKKSFARYLSSHVFKTEVSEKDVLIISGSGAVMDVMGTALLNPAMDGNKSDAFICMSHPLCFLSRHHSVLQLVREQFHAPDGRRDVPRRHHEEQVLFFSLPLSHT